jgi:hypothetical protein
VAFKWLGGALFASCLKCWGHQKRQQESETAFSSTKRLTHEWKATLHRGTHVQILICALRRWSLEGRITVTLVIYIHIHIWAVLSRLWSTKISLNGLFLIAERSKSLAPLAETNSPNYPVMTISGFRTRWCIGNANPQQTGNSL